MLRAASRDGQHTLPVFVPVPTPRPRPIPCRHKTAADGSLGHLLGMTRLYLLVRAIDHASTVVQFVVCLNDCPRGLASRLQLWPSISMSRPYLPRDSISGIAQGSWRLLLVLDKVLARTRCVTGASSRHATPTSHTTSHADCLDSRFTQAPSGGSCFVTYIYQETLPELTEDTICFISAIRPSQDGCSAGT